MNFVAATLRAVGLQLYLFVKRRKLQAVDTEKAPQTHVTVVVALASAMTVAMATIR